MKNVLITGTTSGIGKAFAEKVVRIAYRGMMKGRRLVIPGIYNKLLVASSKALPVSITNRITIFMMEQPVYPFSVKYPCMHEEGGRRDQ